MVHLHWHCLDEGVSDVLTPLVVPDVLTANIYVERKGAFADSEYHPKWPKVAETVIKAG